MQRIKANYIFKKNKPFHKILVLITYACIPYLNIHAQLSSGARFLNFALSSF